MAKTILLTGATDGIGLETAKMLVSQGHRILLHGRNPAKLAEVERALATMSRGGTVEGYVADLSTMTDVRLLANAVTEKHTKLDVLINNAGVFKVPEAIREDGFDVRFVVNTLAPYLLTNELLPLMDVTGRVVNLSSAAQVSVNFDALAGQGKPLDDFSAYAQSKLALTMWSHGLARTLGENGPAIIAVNPGSLLATKMVKEGFGTAGNDVGIGADILCRAALSDDFAGTSGQYFDNDSGGFANPHSDALDQVKCGEVVRVIKNVLQTL